MRNASVLAFFALLLVVVGGCSSGGGSAADSSASSPATSRASSASASPATGSRSFKVEVWADNWFEMYVNGAVVGTDSVPITTERSFNKETFTFTAALPFTLAIQGKDYMKDESGLEYIGTGRQQMGDGGLIAQITDPSTGKVIAVTSGAWKAFVVQEAPLNTDCEKSANPSSDCQSKRVAEPTNWSSQSFDASSWASATVYSEAQVSPKDGYTEVTWDSTAKLIWAGNLKTDNIVLFRTLVTG